MWPVKKLRDFVSELVAEQNQWVTGQPRFTWKTAVKTACEGETVVI